MRRERDATSLSRLEFDFAALPALVGPEGPLGPIWKVAGREGLQRLVPDDVQEPTGDPRSTDARLDDVPVNQDGPVELVLKAAFLVEEARAEAFKACSVELYDRASSRGLTLEVSGPWAPYSFTGARP